MAGLKEFWSKRQFNVSAKVWDREAQSWRYSEGPSEYRIDITIDVEGIIDQLGYKAACNKSHKSHDLGGLVVATVRKI